jgi:hypothetical protein
MKIFQLYQNFPNPHNPTTRINYTITSYNYTSLNVYYPLGQEVKTLLERIHKPGIYKVTINGK